MNSEERFDIAVIGAGPCGSTAALAAARLGMSVALIDRAEHPRGKVCGGCLARAGALTLKSLGAADALRHSLPVKRVEFIAQRRRLSLDLNDMLAVRREIFDHELVGCALRAGVTVLMGSAAELDAHGRLHVSPTPHRCSFSIRAGAFIIADGLAGSSLSKRADFEWRISRAKRIGIGTILDEGALACRPDELQMHMHRCGYVGVVRVPGGIDIAAAIAPRHLQQSGGIDRLMHRWLKDIIQDPDALARAKWKGTPLLTRRRTRIAAPSIIVAGDAAGYVEPFTGDGMSLAMISGARAGQHATAMVRGDAHWEDWPRIHRSVFASHAHTRVMTWLVRSPMLVRAAMCIGRRAPRIIETLRDSIIGSRDAIAALETGR